MKIENLVVSREHVAAAFDEWLRRFREEPEKFDADYGEPSEYGEGCADYLLRLLSESRG
jgi:hypothetical protein